MSDGEQSRYARRWEDVRESVGVAAQFRQWGRARVLDVLSTLQLGAPGPQLRCLHCHAVFEDQQASFRRLMQSLQRSAEFVQTETCLEMIRGETPIDGTYLHLSFDDGFRNNVEYAAPVLGDLGIPAIFFVTTDCVGSGWEGAREFADRRGREGVVEVASWSDLERLESWGFEIGSHTRTHRRLADLRGDDLESEIVDSRRAIRQRLDTDCEYFSWPFGNREDVRPEAIECVRSAGYDACFSGERGSIVPRETDPYRIPRHHFQPHWPISHVRYFAFGESLIWDGNGS